MFTLPSWFGYLTAVVASLMFGSCYVPMKRYDTGDGLFFQWIFGATVFLVGLICRAISGSDVFEWYGVLGGAIWALGNVCVVPILRYLGLGLGFLVWSGVNLLGAYAWGAFGLFGLDREVPKNESISLLGVAFGLFSLLIFLFIKPNMEKSDAEEAAHGEDGYIHGLSVQAHSSDLENVRDDLILRIKMDSVDGRSEGSDFGQGASARGDAAGDEETPLVLMYGERLLKAVPGGGRLFGLILAVWSGLCYSWNMVPYSVWHERYENDHGGDSPGMLDYMFCFSTGVFASASALFLLYCVVTLSRPKMYPAACLPSVLSGVMWCLGTISLMVTAGSLGMTVGYPIVALGPIAVTTFWSVLVFREIRGVVNYILLSVSLALVGCAIACLVVSKLVHIPVLP